MEFNEKLQELRKKKGLTQEELADILFVSRTAVSKWESGRGYPNIESLRDISKYFCVSIDDLLSGERLLYIAENENKSKIKNICSMIFGFVDVFSVLLIILPIYPNNVDGFVYTVNLLNYTRVSLWSLYIHWALFFSLILVGVVKIILTRIGREKGSGILADISLFINSGAVLYLALTREAYAVAIVFFLLIVKGALLLKQNKS
jgi:transcriptional regulator with XRE-family HTH domain